MKRSTKIALILIVIALLFATLACDPDNGDDLTSVLTGALDTDGDGNLSNELLTGAANASEAMATAQP